MPVKISDLFVKKGTNKLTTGAKVGIATALAGGTYLLLKNQQKKKEQQRQKQNVPEQNVKIEEKVTEEVQRLPEERKKSNLPLIIGVSIGGIILVAGIIYFATKKN
jgi:uncharacterized protein HemX